MTTHRREAITRIALSHYQRWAMAGANTAWALAALAHFNLI